MLLGHTSYTECGGKDCAVQMRSSAKFDIITEKKITKTFSFSSTTITINNNKKKEEEKKMV